MFTLEAGRLPVPSPRGAAFRRGFRLKSTTEVASATLKCIKSRSKNAKDDTEREGGEREKVKTLSCSNMYFNPPPHRTHFRCSLKSWSAVWPVGSRLRVGLRFWYFADAF